MSTISPAHHESRLRGTHVPISEALRRYVLVVAVFTLLLAGLGVAWGLHRTPIYTATSENVVRALSPSVAQLPGAIQAAQDLASNQSRLIDSDGIATPVAERLETTSEYVASHVSATPVPGSTVIRIEAEGPSADSAIELANESARAFARYVNVQTTSDAEGTEILELYRAASAAYQRELAAKQGVDRAGDEASPTTRLRVAADVDAAQLRRLALSAQYQTVIQSQGTAPTVKPFVIARTATSDRIATVQLLAVAGALAGFVLGAALAMLLANRRSRRRA